MKYISPIFTLCIFCRCRTASCISSWKLSFFYQKLHSTTHSHMCNMLPQLAFLALLVMKSTGKSAQSCDLSWWPQETCAYMCMRMLVSLPVCGVKRVESRGQLPVIANISLAFVAALTHFDWLSGPAVRAGRGGSSFCSVARLQVYPIDVEI